MKKTYKQPQTLTILLQNHAQLLLVSESYKVNEYQNGDDIIVGDKDEQ